MVQFLFVLADQLLDINIVLLLLLALRLYLGRASIHLMRHLGQLVRRQRSYLDFSLRGTWIGLLIA